MRNKIRGWTIPLPLDFDLLENFVLKAKFAFKKFHSSAHRSSLGNLLLSGGKWQLLDPIF